MADAHPNDDPGPSEQLVDSSKRPPGHSKSATYIRHLKIFNLNKWKELRKKDTERRKAKREADKVPKENQPLTRAEKEKLDQKRELTK